MASPNQLSPGSCLNCRRQKQRCDRLLPQCSRCTSKRVTCDYQAIPHSRISPASPGTLAMLVHLRDSCSFDLSLLAERHLVWAACTGGNDGVDEQPTLSNLIRDVFNAGGVDLTIIIETYFAIAHNWLPILNKEQLYLDTSHFLGCCGYQNDILALLLLCIYIFVQQPCQHPNHPIKSALYRTARRVFFLLQTSACSSNIALLQSGLLLVAYELGHGLSTESYATLVICASLAQQFGRDVGCDQGNEPRPEITDLDLCWSGIILLDSTITLSNFEYRIPQSSIVNRQFIGAAIVAASDEDLYGDDLSRKFVARAQVALRIGKMLDAMTNSGSVQREEAETNLHQLVNSLITRTQSKSFPLCETVAMSLSALAILYCLHNPQISAHSSPAIQCVHNMIFDTVHTEGEIVRSRGWSNTSRPCFLGICCLQGAAIRMDRVYVDGLKCEQLEKLRSTLEAFSTRWKLGELFIRILNSRRDKVE